MITRCLESKEETEFPREESTHCIALQCGFFLHPLQIYRKEKMFNVTAVKNLRPRPQDVLFTDGSESE